MWIDNNIIPYLFRKQGVQADRLTAASIKACILPSGNVCHVWLHMWQTLPGLMCQWWNINKVEAQNKQILPSCQLALDTRPEAWDCKSNNSVSLNHMLFQINHQVFSRFVSLALVVGTVQKLFLHVISIRQVTVFMSESIESVMINHLLSESLNPSLNRFVKKKQIHLGINKWLSLWQNQLSISKTKTKTKHQRFAAAALFGNIFNGSV